MMPVKKTYRAGLLAVVLAAAFALGAAFPLTAQAQTADGAVGINLNAPSTVQQDASAGEGTGGLVGVNVTAQKPSGDDSGAGSGEGPAGGAAGLVGVNVTVPETARQDPDAGEGSQGLVGVNVVAQRPAADEGGPAGDASSSGGAAGLVGVNVDVPSTALHDPDAGEGADGLVGINVVAQNGLFVTFDPNGGTMPATTVGACYGETIDMPGATPDWPGRTFGKLIGGERVYWFKDSACTEPWDFAADVVKDATTLYAGWTWDEPHAVGRVVLHTMYGNTVIDNAASWGLSGYAPNYDSDAHAGATEGATDESLVYEGEYYLGGGEPLDATLELPEARMIKTEKLSGTFLGWYDEHGDKRASIDRFSRGAGEPDYTQELWARWDTTPTHTVAFDAGENAWFDEPGNPRWKYVEVADRKTVERPADPVHAADAVAAPGGWRFGGWFYDEACTQPYPFGSHVAADLTLHAKWDPVEVVPGAWSLTFHAGDGVIVGRGDGGADVKEWSVTGSADDPHVPADAVPGQADMRRTGYTFGGWYPALADGSGGDFGAGPFDFEAAVEGDAHVWAKWNLRLDVTVPVSVGFAVDADSNEVTTPDAEKYALKSRTVRPVTVDAVAATSEEEELEEFFSLPDGEAWGPALGETTLSLRPNGAEPEVRLALADGAEAAPGVWKNAHPLVDPDEQAAFTIGAFSYGGVSFDESWQGSDPSERLPLKLGMELSDGLRVKTALDGPRPITRLTLTVSAQE